MEKTEKEKFTVSFKEQMDDGLITSSDMIAYLQNTMKVKNSKALAARVLDFSDKTDEIELAAEKNSVLKKNLKLYIKRYLRSKDLSNFIKVRGCSKEGLRLEYVNKVDDEE